MEGLSARLALASPIASLAAAKAYAEKLREAVTTTFLTLEGQFVLTGQLSGGASFVQYILHFKAASQHKEPHRLLQSPASCTSPAAKYVLAAIVLR